MPDLRSQVPTHLRAKPRASKANRGGTKGSVGNGILELIDGCVKARRPIVCPVRHENKLHTMMHVVP